MQDCSNVIIPVCLQVHFGYEITTTTFKTANAQKQNTGTTVSRMVLEVLVVVLLLVFIQFYSILW